MRVLVVPVGHLLEREADAVAGQARRHQPVDRRLEQARGGRQEDGEALGRIDLFRQPGEAFGPGRVERDIGQPLGEFLRRRRVEEFGRDMLGQCFDGAGAKGGVVEIAPRGSDDRQVRGKQAVEAIAVLRFAPQSASDPVQKVLESAIANARVKADKASEAFDERDLVISAAFVDEGPTMKRFRPRAQGRAARINKRTSHITVVVTPKTTKGGTR